MMSETMSSRQITVLFALAEIDRLILNAIYGASLETLSPMN